MCVATNGHITFCDDNKSEIDVIMSIKEEGISKKDVYPGDAAPALSVSTLSGVNTFTLSEQKARAFHNRCLFFCYRGGQALSPLAKGKSWLVLYDQAKK